MNNTKLWKEAYVTDPKAVKPITGKQYGGNSPKPYWIVQRATELLGPCGIGWRPEIVSERVERFGDSATGEAIHIAQVRLHYTYDGKEGVIEQMGQTRMAYMTSKGKYMVDEDAPKKSVTDAMVKCLSLIGFAGDIFSGRWDDSRYVDWAAQETHRREEESANAESDKAYQELHKRLEDAAKQGREKFTETWKKFTKEDRQFFGAANLTQFQATVDAADNAKKPLTQRMSEAKDLDALYAMADIDREMTQEERDAFEKRQLELQG